MKNRLLHKISLVLGCGITALVLSSGAFAQHSGGGGGGGGGHASGGGGGGGHASAGGSPGGAHGGAVYGGGYHGGYYGGGYRGGYGYGYGYRGGYYGGWRGGYYGGWGCCGWGWGWGGLGLGLYFATLPLYYNTYWWNGVPYYYSNNTYYIYDPNAKQYQTVAPPAGLQDQSGNPAPGPSSDLIAYPKNGQSAEQQSKDKFECHQWAVGQTGFDPTQGSAAAATGANKQSDYMRAQAACLEGRGYSVQ
jgi:hypothetical protein